jgi:uncharacterized protein
MRYFLPLLAMTLAWSGCSPKTETMDALQSVTVTLPGGKRILAEVKIQPADLARGMMFRDALPAGQGMLFMHGKADYYTYWMYQCRIPLDIIWLDANRRIVEIAADAPPCKTVASECPKYGGHSLSLFVLELGGGEAARNGLRVGDTLSF